MLQTNRIGPEERSRIKAAALRLKKDPFRIGKAKLVREGAWIKIEFLGPIADRWCRIHNNGKITFRKTDPNRKKA